MSADQSSGSSSLSNGSESKTGPVHVLMLHSSHGDALDRSWRFDPRLQNDYIVKRRKAYSPTIKSTDKPVNSSTSVPSSLWEGVSKLEHALIQCCEPIDSTQVVQGENPMAESGVLEIEKEVRFAGLLAKECHSMATRSVALAILERTLEALLNEKMDERERNKRSTMDEKEHSNEDKAKESSDSEEEEEEEDYTNGRKRRSRRLMQQRPVKYKRTKRKTEEDKQPRKENKFNYDKWSRLERFLAAGGLKILNRWLIEASQDDIVQSTTPPTGNRTRGQTTVTVSKPSSTRPLILPILRLLEHIPFDKKLVVDSKVNKQIKKIEKQVDGILQARAQRKHRREDLQNWTIATTTSDTDALEHVKEAIDNVKKSWGDRAKKEKENFDDPFETIEEKLKERLQEVIEFEAGSISRPQWLGQAEEIKKTSTPKTAKSSTQELAARERQAERTEMQKRLRVAQDEHREHLARLRQLRKVQEDKAPARGAKRNGGKAVKWKDGMKSKISNRKDLEEVFVFLGSTPANKDMNEPIEDADDERPDVEIDASAEMEETGDDFTEDMWL